MANFFDQFDAPAATPPAAMAISSISSMRAAPAPERSFTEKLGNFARNVYENPPPSVAACAMSSRARRRRPPN